MTDQLMSLFVSHHVAPNDRGVVADDSKHKYALTFKARGMVFTTAWMCGNDEDIQKRVDALKECVTCDLEVME